MRRGLTAAAICLASRLLGCGAQPAAEEPWQTEPGPLMRPGDNCLRCHNSVNGTAPPWTAGGTVFATVDAARTDGVPGVTVVLTDASGKELRLTTNDAGNFYTAQELVAPFRVRLEHGGAVVEMPEAPPAGSCNACHADPPLAAAPGRIVIP